MHTKHCRNCGKPLHGSFCSHCGQKAEVDRITFTYIWHELFHFFTHVEKGFLFTSLRMLKSPGRTVKEFIDGKRKKYQPPISYFLIWTTIYILFLYWIEHMFGENTVINYKEYFGPSATTKFAISHLSIVLTIVIPFQALYLFLLVTKSTYNYFETIVASIYTLGTIILLQFVFAVTALLIYAIVSKSIELRISDAFKILYLLWFIADFIKLFPVNLKFLRATIFILLAFGTFTTWRLYGFPLLANWLFVK
jgi:hypothetical protein